VKGVNTLNFLYLGQELVIPVTMEIIKKPGNTLKIRGQIATLQD